MSLDGLAPPLGAASNGGRTQLGFLGEWWEEEWRGMPEFVQERQAPYHTLEVRFADREGVEAFSRLVGQDLTEAGPTRTRHWMWYPPKRYGRWRDWRWHEERRLAPRYPVYVPSKGRWETRQTARALERIGVPYHVVVEPQERAAYAAVIDPAKILVLPFSDLGLVPARNWIMEHAVAGGAKRHWQIDDNIEGFYRLNHNLKTPVASGTIFRCAEDFVDRYENVALAGFHYFMFASRKCKLPPFILNTRIYSCTLVNNSISHRWRGIYNEDTDISLRVLKDGWCTVLFLAFLCGKRTTMTVKGGNTDELYRGDGRLRMARALQEQHPDVTQITWKWGRWQHHVDYRPFKRNRLRPRSDVNVSEGVNNYGMTLMVDEGAAAHYGRGARFGEAYLIGAGGPRALEAR